MRWAGERWQDVREYSEQAVYDAQAFGNQVIDDADSVRSSWASAGASP